MSFLRMVTSPLGLELIALAFATGVVTVLAALLAAAETMLLSDSRTAHDPDAPAAVKDARAFPRRAVSALWLAQDLVLAGAAGLGLVLMPQALTLGVALTGAALVTGLVVRALVARFPQPMRGPGFQLALALAPSARLLMAVGRFAARRLKRGERDAFAEDDAEQPEEGSESVLDPEERDLLVKVRSFGSRHVREVMTPRIEIFCLSDEMPPAELVQAVDEARFSRVPIYHGEKDNLIGLLYVKDLLGRRLVEGFNLTGLLHRPTVVPPDKPIDEVFRELRRSKVHMALVIDELGSLVGLVTMEDVLEELFGEIRDESDEAEPRIERRGAALLVPGRLSISQLAAELERPIELSGAETTVGGVLIAQAGKVPREGDRFEVDGLTFTVERREGTVVKRVRVEPAC